jgi:hypothetical protein
MLLALVIGKAEDTAALAVNEGASFGSPKRVIVYHVI